MLCSDFRGVGVRLAVFAFGETACLVSVRRSPAVRAARPLMRVGRRLGLTSILGTCMGARVCGRCSCRLRRRGVYPEGLGWWGSLLALRT